MNTTEVQMLGDVHKGDMLTIHDHNGTLLRVEECRAESTAEIGCGMSQRYKRKTGKRVGGNYFARPATAEQVAAAKAELKRRDDEQEAAEAAKRQAEYDALPEAVKLVMALKWVFDCTSKAKIAEAPIEHLRGLVKWAKANNLETE